MTSTVMEFSNLMASSKAGCPHRQRHRPQSQVTSNPLATLLRRPGQVRRGADTFLSPASRPGAIGGAVVQAARRSTGLTRRALARLLAVSPATVRGWENGITPLFTVSYARLRELAEALTQAGAQAGRVLGDLVLASQCDLLVSGMLHSFEDYAEVPPVEEDTAEGEAVRGLLRWALIGMVPERYRAHARPGPLLDEPSVIQFTGVARTLQAGSQADHLASYGAALLALTIAPDAGEGTRHKRRSRARRREGR